MKILIGVGDPVRFDELPDSLDFETRGIVSWINVHSNTVGVDVPEWGEVLFSLDGSSWSDCGAFKRDILFVSWD
jgi:hypothetical protein